MSIVAPSSSEARIPPEIYGLIIQHISHHPTLLNLCLSSKSIYPDASRMLYSKIAKDSPTADILFLQTITQNEHLAAMVRGYRSWFIVRNSESSAWSLLASGLRCMVNLKYLDLLSIGGNPCAELMLHAPFQLKTLVWRCRLESDREIEVLEEVLLEQRKLEVLYVPEYRSKPAGRRVKLLVSEEEGLKNSLTNLHTLVGSPFGIAAMMLFQAQQGRFPEIKEIKWEQRRDVFPVDEYLLGPVNNIAKGFSSVTLLSFGPCHSRPSLVDIGAQNLQQLEVLQLFGWFQEEEFIIKQLPSLRELVISEQFIGRPGMLMHNLTALQCLKIARSLFDSLRVLSQIDVFFPPSELSGPGYYRWTRDSPGRSKHLKESAVQERISHLLFSPLGASELRIR